MVSFMLIIYVLIASGDARKEALNVLGLALPLCRAGPIPLGGKVSLENSSVEF